jgi:hypothetical protein
VNEVASGLARLTDERIEVEPVKKVGGPCTCPLTRTMSGA